MLSLRAVGVERGVQPCRREDIAAIARAGEGHAGLGTAGVEGRGELAVDRRVGAHGEGVHVVGVCVSHGGHGKRVGAGGDAGDD